jgi:hypothetical protein
MTAAEIHDRLVLSDGVLRTDGAYIPKLECWFPADMPLECISEILILKLRRRALDAHAEVVLRAHGK